jgi:membrane fusion protein
MRGLFREEVVQARNRLSGDINISQFVPLTILTYVILFILIVSTIYLFKYKYNNKVTVGGYIFPAEGHTKIHAPLSGVLSSLNVYEGKIVEAGHSLFKVEANISLANESNYHKVIISNLVEISRSIEKQLDSEEVLLGNLLVQLDRDIKLLTEQISTLKSQQSLYMQRVKLNEDVVKDFESLASVGHVSKLDLSMQRYGLLSLYQTGISIDSQIVSLIRELADRKNQKEINVLESRRRIGDLKSRLHDINNQLAVADFSSGNIVASPRSGSITGITYAEGSMVTQGEVLLNILPVEPNLHGVIYVPTASIGFMQVGQHVRVRVRAFPYQRFGSINGTVVEVSDVATNYDHYFDVAIPELSYRVIVKLDNDSVFAYGRTYNLRLGMDIEADVILDERSLLQWVFEPIYSLRGKL